MKKTIITTQLALALLVAPVFAGNDKNYTYLALGDSVAFGMDPRLIQNPTQLPKPESFVGYPEVVAALEHLYQSKKAVNASCPGETSASFLGLTLVDFGCNSPHQVPGGPLIMPFKPTGLHTSYTVPQMQFAVSELKANKQINLVTLSIGANDVLLALGQCTTDPCWNAVLGAYGQNLAMILSGIRTEYRGTLIVVKYYSPMPELDGITVVLNGVMDGVAAQLALQPDFAPVKFADGFAAFKKATAIMLHGRPGAACEAGLLISFSSPGTQPCDIHPSPLGQGVLAAALELAKWSNH